MNGRVFINEPRRLGYTFGGLPAVGVIQPGRLAVIEMQDCFGGLVTGPSTPPAAVCDLSRGSPVSGPFYVEGAEPGDTVAVHVVSLSPARGWAVSAVIPPAAGDVVPLRHPAPRERVWRHDLDLTAGSARFNSTDGSHAISLPLRPVIGTVGVAPKAGEVISTLTPGPHGGNLGSTCITAGVTVFLPVNLPGGLFAIGDGYAMPGDGTASRMAVQCAMTVTLMVGLIKEIQAPLIRLESDDSLHSVGYGRPLENALWGAQADLGTWMQQLTGMDALDCAQLLALAGSTSIGNLYAAAFTAVATYPKALLPSVQISALGGMHRRLRHQSLPPKNRDVPMPAET